MIVIGIDPGTRITGFGVVETNNSSLYPLDYGCINLPDSALSIRYLTIFESIDLLIEKYKPEALSIETQYIHKNIQSAIKLGMARCSATLAATRKNIPVFEYTPSKAKRAIVGNGRASKQQVQGMIRVILNLQTIPQPDDAADALALAICHIHATNNFSINKNQV